MMTKTLAEARPTQLIVHPRTFFEIWKQCEKQAEHTSPNQTQPVDGKPRQDGRQKPMVPTNDTAVLILPIYRY